MDANIHYAMSNADYHAKKDSYSSSLIKMMDVPAEARHYMTAPREYKQCWSIGSAIHKYILEREDFSSEFLTGISEARRSSANKKDWAQWFSDQGADGSGIVEGAAATWNGKFEQQTGKNMVTPEEIADIKMMSDAICDDPDALQLIVGGAAESSIFWTDEDTGLRLRIRPDYFTDNFTTDLKSIESLSDASITRAIANMGYGISAAMYQDGTFNLTGNQTPFVFLFIQKKAPFMTRTICLDELSQSAFLQKYIGLKEKLANCIRNDVWKKRENDLSFSLPDWAVFKGN